MTPTSLQRQTQGQGRGDRRVRGIVLIEALVGILIFSFGVLGLVGLQMYMSKAQTDAKFRADAAAAASELTGVMWSDAANLAKYNDEPCPDYARCKDWTNKLAAQLPSGAASVAVDGATGAVSITIWWQRADEDRSRFDLNTRVIR